MKKYKITIEYDGTNYYGWQIQKNGPTIQGELEKALWRMLREEIKVIGAGRTDRGVHATGQVAHFATSREILPRKIHLGLNSFLPWDITIQRIEEVPMDFHATLSAKSKIYRYSVLNQTNPSALLWKYSQWCSYELNLEKMREGASFLLGTHNFSSFETVNSPRKTSVRTVMRLEVQKRFWKNNSLVDFIVEANGFLYNMVRSISGTLLEVGREKISPRQIKEILEAQDRTKAGPTAEARGLCLEEVKY